MEMEAAMGLRVGMGLKPGLPGRVEFRGCEIHGPHAGWKKEWAADERG